MSESLIKPGNFVKVAVPLNTHSERNVIGLIFTPFYISNADSLSRHILM